MDALALGLLVFLAGVLLIPACVLAVRMLRRYAHTGRLASLPPSRLEVRYLAAYACLVPIAILLGIYAFADIGLVGVPCLVLYFAVRLATLPNTITTPTPTTTPTDRCEACGYDMAGLEADRCPECGAEWGAALRPGQHVEL